MPAVLPTLQIGDWGRQAEADQIRVAAMMTQAAACMPPGDYSMGDAGGKGERGKGGYAAWREAGMGERGHMC